MLNGAAWGVGGGIAMAFHNIASDCVPNSEKEYGRSGKTPETTTSWPAARAKPVGRNAAGSSGKPTWVGGRPRSGAISDHDTPEFDVESYSFLVNPIAGGDSTRIRPCCRSSNLHHSDPPRVVTDMLRTKLVQVCPQSWVVATSIWFACWD